MESEYQKQINRRRSGYKTRKGGDEKKQERVGERVTSSLRFGPKGRSLPHLSMDRFTY